jgi:hypothetical protein
MLRRVTLVGTDVSEELSASIIRVTRIGKLGTTLAVTKLSSQKTPFFIKILVWENCHANLFSVGLIAEVYVYTGVFICTGLLFLSCLSVTVIIILLFTGTYCLINQDWNNWRGLGLTLRWSDWGSHFRVSKENRKRMPRYHWGICFCKILKVCLYFLLL